MQRKHAKAHIFLHHADDAFIHHAHDLHMLRNRIDLELIDTRADGKQDFEIAVTADIIGHGPGDEIAHPIRIDGLWLHRKGKVGQITGESLPENLAAPGI